jgi:hypothetical protein
LINRCPRHRWRHSVHFLPELQHLGRGHLADGAVQQTTLLVLNARGSPIAHHGVRYGNQTEKSEKADEREPVYRKCGVLDEVGLWVFISCNRVVKDVVK